jgi:hypothetical protein
MKILEHNVETGQAVERNMTKAEADQYAADQAAQIAKVTEAQAKATEKAALLDRLGITADEAALLLS